MKRLVKYAYPANAVLTNRKAAEGEMKDFAEEQAELVGVQIEWNVDRSMAVGSGAVVV